MYSGEKYLNTISKFNEEINQNSLSTDWSIRYFASQVYLDLYSKSKNDEYLYKAYDIVSNNVTELLKEQRTLNNEYLSDVVELEIKEPDYRYMTDEQKKEAKKEYKEEKNRVKDYNKALSKKRETELLTLYEPLVLNCELLFGLEEKLNLSKNEKEDMDAVLGTENNQTFLVKPINSAYSFSKVPYEITITFTKNEIIIPANLLTANSKITVTVSEGKNKTKVNDCVIKKVDRKDDNFDSFTATVTSKSLKKYQWTPNSKITITITYKDACDKKAYFKFKVHSYEKVWNTYKLEFKAE